MVKILKSVKKTKAEGPIISDEHYSDKQRPEY